MIASLWLKNFRRYTDEKFEFKSGINFITGKNNVGKSTIFYAIEYVLFGRVGHFKSPIALMQPGSRTVGVEIVFEARDGYFYRLQRIHAMPPKARSKVNGHYTLKQLNGDPKVEKDLSESYVLSSDFQDHEETLALKLNELLGLSHKLFDVAINLRQGEITSVLEGAPKLDIVLGITAAVLAAEQMRSMALEFEKESASYELHLQQVSRLENEQKSQKDQLQQLQDESATLDTRAIELTSLSALSQQIDDIKLPLTDQQRNLEQQLLVAEQLADQQQQIALRFHALIKEQGSVESLQIELDKMSKETVEHQKNKQKWSTQESELNQKKSELDQLLGDLSGRIKRRESLPSGEGAECETCGQIIDSESNQKEIEKWQQESAQISQQCIDIEQQQADVKQQSKTVDEAIRTIDVQSNLHRRAIDDLKQLDSEQQLHEKNVSDQAATLIAAGEAVIESIEQYSMAVATLNVEKETVQLLSLGLPDSKLKKHAKEELWQDLFSLVSPVLQELEERLKVRVIQAETELQGIQANQQRVADELIQMHQREGQLEREITEAREQVDRLLEKQTAAEQLRTLLAGFKELQTQLRDKVSTKLGQDTFKLHQALSHPDKEFKSLTIDPTRYLINVVPKDLGKEVPAYLYQGGGHKLLLGVAFKLAIAKTVGPCSFMLLDEPTYGLDEVHRNSLLQRLSELNVTEQVFLITHDINEVEGHRIAINSQGKTSTQEES